MTTAIDLLINGWNRNHAKAVELTEHVPNEIATNQLGGIVNHPAWTFAHMNLYHDAILSLACGERINDPGKHPDAPKYDAGSIPVHDPDAYPPLDELVRAYTVKHEQIEATLRDAQPSLLDHPPRLERWAEALGTTGQTLNYLMLYHESTHLGQLMAWRRAAGLPACE